MSCLTDQKCDIMTLWKRVWPRDMMTLWKNSGRIFRVDVNQPLGVDCFWRCGHHGKKGTLFPKAHLSHLMYICVELWIFLCGWNIHDKQFPCVRDGPENLWDPSYIRLYRFFKNLPYLNYTFKFFHNNAFVTFGAASGITNYFHFNAGISSSRLWLMLILKHGMTYYLKCLYSVNLWSLFLNYR